MNHTLTQRTKNSTSIKEFEANSESLERFPHLDYEFLKPDKICDAERRPLKHPDYDPKTLWVPKDFMQKQTPGNFFKLILNFL